jgi:hypothetical protein
VFAAGDQSIRYPAGIAEDIPVKIRDFFVPVDFVVLDMEVDTKTPLILGRPFLSTARANIDVGAGEILLNINGQKEKFTFKPKVEQCAQVKAVTRKPSKKRRGNPSIPTMDEIIMTLEALRLYKATKSHNRKQAIRRIQRKKALESEQEGKVDPPPTTRKVWRKKVPLSEASGGEKPPTESSGGDQAQQLTSPAQDRRDEPSP